MEEAVPTSILFTGKRYVSKDFTAGTLAGISGVAVGHPFDTIKVRVQTGQFSSVTGCLIQTLKNENIRGLFKGVSAPLATDAASQSMVFGIYGYMQKTFREMNEKNGLGTEISLKQVGVSGAVAGIGCCLILSPVELIKSRLQIQLTENARYGGPIDCVKSILAEGGIRGIYRGLFATFVRDIPGFALYFGSYEGLKRTFSPTGKSKDIPISHLLLSGGLAGSLCWTVIYPADIIKTRLQTDDSTRSFTEVAKKIYNTGGRGIPGFKSFYKGLTPTVIRSFPVNATIFAVYEGVLHLLQ